MSLNEEFKMAMQTALRTDSSKDWAKVNKLEALLLQDISLLPLVDASDFVAWDEPFSFEPKKLVPEPYQPAKFDMSFKHLNRCQNMIDACNGDQDLIQQIVAVRD